MIKLIDLLKERNEETMSPEELGDLGFVMGKPGEKELFKKGYISKDITDPKTGEITTQIISLPKFDRLKNEVLKIRKEIQPFKFSTNENIVKVSKEAIKKLTQVNNFIFALDRLIALEKEQQSKQNPD